MTHLVCRETIWVIKVSLDQFRVRTFVDVGGVATEGNSVARTIQARYVNRRYSRVPKCRKVNYIVKIAFKIALLAQRMQLHCRGYKGLGPGPLRPVCSRSLIVAAQRKRAVSVTYSLSMQLVGTLAGTSASACLQTFAQKPVNGDCLCILSIQRARVASCHCKVPTNLLKIRRITIGGGTFDDATRERRNGMPVTRECRPRAINRPVARVTKRLHAEVLDPVVGSTIAIVNSDGCACILRREEVTFSRQGVVSLLTARNSYRRDRLGIPRDAVGLRARDVVVLISRCTGRRNGKWFWRGYLDGQKETKHRREETELGDGRWLLYSTRAGNAREKAKDSAGLRAKRQTDETNRVREEDENVDWPQIESHPFITPGCVSLGSVSSYPFLPSLGVRPLARIVGTPGKNRYEPLCRSPSIGGTKDSAVRE